jgi:hypothetical protein
MNATAPLDHEVIDEDQLTDVRWVRKAQYARTRDGRELILTSSATQGVLERDPVPGQVIVTAFLRERGDDGRMTPRHVLIRGRVLPKGSIAAAERAAARTKAPPTPRPVDGLAQFRAAVPRTIVALRPESEDVNKTILAKTPSTLITRGRVDLRSAAEIVAVLRQHGVTLAVSKAGDLIVEATALRPVDAELLSNVDMRRLLAAWVAGKPLRCAWPHPSGKAPEATTTAVGGAPVCDEHLRGEA